MDKSKRRLFKAIGTGLLYLPLSSVQTMRSVAASTEQEQLFHRIYSNDYSSSAFEDHSLNSATSYISPLLVQLAKEEVNSIDSDEVIYRKVQSKWIDSLEASDHIFQAFHENEKMNNAIDMTEALLLGNGRDFSMKNHIDIGSRSHYMDRLWQQLPLVGDAFSVNKSIDSSSVEDMLCVGQSDYMGDLALYEALPSHISQLPFSSISLVTAYSGFSHYDATSRTSLINLLSNRLQQGGYLVVQEKDITSTVASDIALLADYLINVQNGLSWDENITQQRWLTSSAEQEKEMLLHGLRMKGSQVLSRNDFTKTSIMYYQKVS